LSQSDWLYCLMIASAVLWLRELNKGVTRALKDFTYRSGSRG
jgi:hypothetical protein